MSRFLVHAVVPTARAVSWTPLLAATAGLLALALIVRSQEAGGTALKSGHLESPVVRAKETRYRVPGWGVGELWTSDRAVLAHEFAFDAVPAVELRGESLPNARPLEGAASPPLGTLSGHQARKGNSSVPTPREPSAGAELDADELVARVTDYLTAADVGFDDVPLDLVDCTAFQHAVVFSLRAIPRGEVVGYGELAALAGYRNAPVRAVTLDSRRQGLGPIGHMGYFRPRAQPLWNDALAWFDSLTTPSARAATVPG